MTFFLVWFGAWVSAVAYAMHIVLSEAGWDAALKSRDNAKVSGGA
ncbi:hypothetical protein [Sulfuriferula sp. AH1]|nr:hypothetical protein [Sulfuriferula sp. AH1]